MNAVPVGLGAGEPRIRLSPLRGEHESSGTFRRGQAVRRSRRGLLKRRLKLLAAAVILVSIPSAAVTWLMISPRFAIRELAVVTGERVPDVWVREALAPMVGENLPRLPLARAEHVLRRHPWVRGADLRKDLPSRLAVRVAERRAVALLRTGDGLHHLDPHGAHIAPFDPAEALGVDLPLITIGAGARSSGSEVEGEETDRLRSAVRLLSEIEEAAPAWSAGLSEVEVLGEKDFRIHTSALPFAVLITAGTLNQRVRRLEELLPQIVARFGAGSAVDLRFARRIIVKPSVSVAGPSGSARRAEYREAISNHAQRG